MRKFSERATLIAFGACFISTSIGVGYLHYAKRQGMLGKKRLTMLGEEFDSWKKKVADMQKQAQEIITASNVGNSGEVSDGDMK
jgi:hypothetical protein